MEEGMGLLEFNELSLPELLRPDQYTELLACYLLQNDLSNAKFLWKRIPPEVKTYEELGAVWRVGQKLWVKDMTGFYAEISSFPWTASIAGIMNQLLEFQRMRTLNLIEVAYTSITPQDVAKYLGLTVEEAEAAACTRGWSKEDGMLLPKENPAKPVKINSAEEQLGKLTDFVTFLEN